MVRLLLGFVILPMPARTPLFTHPALPSECQQAVPASHAEARAVTLQFDTNNDVSAPDRFF
jgi:hypothetical protein